jgi:hypothetical protein
MGVAVNDHGIAIWARSPLASHSKHLPFAKIGIGRTLPCYRHIVEIQYQRDIEKKSNCVTKNVIFAVFQTMIFLNIQIKSIGLTAPLSWH